MYSVLTCADTNFYPMALCLARNIRNCPGYKLFLYDLGLQDPEREKLRELDVTIEQIPQRNDIFDFNSKHNIRTTHKMGCIDHFLRKYKESVLVLDADVLLIEDIATEIFPAEKEIVVTYRCDREKKQHILINGKINAGVMGFGSGVESSFFDKWKELCEDKEHTDQSAISALLEQQVELENIDSLQRYDDYTVRILDGNIYNDVTCRIGKIFHFKNAGRHLNKRLGFSCFSFIQYRFPHVVAAAVRFNREKKLWIWRGKKDV